jgi:hypothetical protein
MSKVEKERLKLVRGLMGPARIYELHFAVVSDTEWAASVATKDGQDRRFRYTKGKLFDEAHIGDARV